MRQHSVVNPSCRALRMRLSEWTSSRNLSCAVFGTKGTARPALSVIQYRFDSRQRGSRNWSRLTPIVDFAAIRCDPGHQAGDADIGAQLHVGVGRGLLPIGSGLEPEDRRGDGLAAIPRGLAEEALGDPGVRLEGCAVEFLAVVLLERRLAHPDHFADLVLGHPIGGKRSHLLAGGLA